MRWHPAAPLLLTALLGAVGCGGEKVEGNVLGNVTVMIQADAGLPLQRIDYEIKGRAGSSVRGTVRVDELTKTISANVRGLPIGKGYEVTLSAASADGDLSCAGKAAFEVMSTQTTAVNTRLVCTSRSGASPGGVVRSYCPLVRSAMVAPTQTAVGGSVMVSVEAAPPGPEKATFAWTGTGGTFGDPTAPITTFKCEVEGTHPLNLRITAGTCADRTILTVKCAGMTCGNGAVDFGETCDDGNRADNDGCPSDCLLPGCGNGKIDSNETCEPPGSPGCDLQCRKMGGCGNGVLEPDEACDDGNRAAGDGCAADCSLEALCGDGQVGAGEDCEPPGVGNCNALCHTGPQL
jgi:cysteine-rich repeat protein